VPLFLSIFNTFDDSLWLGVSRYCQVRKARANDDIILIYMTNIKIFKMPVSSIVKEVDAANALLGLNLLGARLQSHSCNRVPWIAERAWAQGAPVRWFAACKLTC
jgi:hypothetical protein